MNIIKHIILPLKEYLNENGGWNIVVWLFVSRTNETEQNSR